MNDRIIQGYERIIPQKERIAQGFADVLQGLTALPKHHDVCVRLWSTQDPGRDTPEKVLAVVHYRALR
jgi:hypothetical protein